MAMRTRNYHPLRGFFGGLFLGLGIALLLVLYGKIAFGTLTPYVIILAGVVLGVVWAYIAPVRGRGGGGDGGVNVAAPPPPPPPASPPAPPLPAEPEPEPEP